MKELVPSYNPYFHFKNKIKRIDIYVKRLIGLLGPVMDTLTEKPNQKMVLEIFSAIIL